VTTAVRPYAGSIVDCEGSAHTWRCPQMERPRDDYLYSVGRFQGQRRKGADAPTFLGIHRPRSVDNNNNEIADEVDLSLRL